MRPMIFAGMLLFASSITQAQLKNTKWAGKMNVPFETAVVLDFKTDSVDMIIADEARVGETMSYSVHDSILTMKKISGHSPCSVDDLFKLKYSIKDDKLSISNFSDACDARTKAWPDEPFVRVKQ